MWISRGGTVLQLLHIKGDRQDRVRHLEGAGLKQPSLESVSSVNIHQDPLCGWDYMLAAEDGWLLKDWQETCKQRRNAPVVTNGTVAISKLLRHRPHVAGMLRSMTDPMRIKGQAGDCCREHFNAGSSWMLLEPQRSCWMGGDLWGTGLGTSHPTCGHSAHNSLLGTRKTKLPLLTGRKILREREKNGVRFWKIHFVFNQCEVVFLKPSWIQCCLFITSILFWLLLSLKNAICRWQNCLHPQLKSNVMTQPYCNGEIKGKWFIRQPLSLQPMCWKTWWSHQGLAPVESCECGQVSSGRTFWKVEQLWEIVLNKTKYIFPCNQWLDFLKIWHSETAKIFHIYIQNGAKF